MENKKTEEQKILIVEDDQSLLGAMVEKFTREGFLVLKSVNGAAGFALALQERPDLILLDILLPELDGLSFLQKLRKENEWGKSVPVIFLTNLSPHVDRIIARIAEDEPAYYLVKTDIVLSEVVAKVRERLSRKDVE